jgi:hypothetical protein
MLQIALALAQKGLAIFPCKEGGKEPAAAGGCTAASRNPSMLAHWWGLNCNFNIALATGRASGIFAIDVDGVDAEAELRKLEAAHGDLPPSIEVTTPRPGRHIYFKMPADVDVRNSAGRIAPGVDVRGTGGYCLVPPSLHPSGKRYRWSVDCSDHFADAPDWLLARIAKGGNGNGEATPPAVWRELIAGGVDEGQRDCTVAKLAGHLLRRFVDAHVVLELLQVWNAARCRPPLPAEDVTRIVDSICGAELRRRGRTP